MADTDPTEPHEAIEARLSDYHDGTLSDDDRAEVETHLATCEPCRAAYQELVDTMTALSGMKTRKAAAPAELPQKVTETIHRRSAGRFFARKTLGDRVPFGVLLIVAIVLLGVVALALRSSPTGSMPGGRKGPGAPPPSGHIVPEP